MRDLPRDTVYLDGSGDALVIIDQTRLPGETVPLSLTTAEEVRDAIRSLKVRGAPAIGVAAAYGLYLAVKALGGTADPLTGLREAKQTLASARPTAVNLFWALERMERAAMSAADKTDIKEVLRREATAIRDEDVAACRAIGEYGLTLLNDGDCILTHCNAGRLAAVRYGTALAPVYVGLERGMRFSVYAGETRPLLQGARLTAYELYRAGADVTLICDNMASRVMASGRVRAALTGADRIAANGDVCNKIGTSGVAILAGYYGIPFYVCAPSSTVDFNTKSGADIPIEERSADEVTKMWYERPMAPEGVRVYNPAFDVTPAPLVAAIVTERGVIRPPFDINLRKTLDL